MTFKKLTLVFLSLILILSETFAKEYSFILKEDAKNKLSFVLELSEGDVIYSNIKRRFKSFSYKY